MVKRTSLAIRRSVESRLPHGNQRWVRGLATSLNVDLSIRPCRTFSIATTLVAMGPGIVVPVNQARFFVRGVVGYCAMLKYLRIAVTALCLTACGLLIALWVRSHWWMDNVEIWSGNRIMSVDGSVHLNELVRINTRQPQTIGLFGNQSFPAGALIPVGVGIAIPYVIAVAATAGLAVAPWFQWSRRFSIRTLLIATALVAVALGIVAVSS